MACASFVSPIEIFASDEVGRRRHWSDEDKIRIVEESLRGYTTLQNLGYMHPYDSKAIYRYVTNVT